MKLISAEVVEQTVQRLEDLSVRQGEQLAQRFIEEQPMLMAYLMAVDKDLFNEEEREVFFYLGTIIWQLMSPDDVPLPPVTEQMLEQAEAANRQALKSLASASDDDARAAMGKMLRDYGQPHVLKYVITELMESSHSEGIRQDNLGLMVLDLKTMIDCLDWKVEVGN